MRSMTPWAAPLSAVLTASLLAGCGLGQEPRRTLVRADDDRLLVINDPRITESSGLAASVKHPGVLYTHNDRGSGPQVFAVAESGAVEAVIELVGAPNEDWEDLTVIPGGNVWIGDIGGNEGAGRSEVSLVWFEEPGTLGDGQAEWLSFDLAYEDGPHDAEALLVDPRDRRKYIVTKDSPVGGIYAAPPRLKRNKPSPLERIGDAPPNITGGSFAPDGEGLVLRNYRQAFIYTALDDPDPVTVELPQSAKGESVILLEDGDLLVGSEGRPSEVVKVPVPETSGQ